MTQRPRHFSANDVVHPKDHFSFQVLLPFHFPWLQHALNFQKLCHFLERVVIKDEPVKMPVINFVYTDDDE